METLTNQLHEPRSIDMLQCFLMSGNMPFFGWTHGILHDSADQCSSYPYLKVDAKNTRVTQRLTIHILQCYLKKPVRLQAANRVQPELDWQPS